MPGCFDGSISPPRRSGSELRAGVPFVIWYRSQCANSSSNITFIKEHPINPENLAILCAEYAANKKAEEIVVIDLRGISSFTDFFVICSGTSEPHLKAIAGEIEDRLRKDHSVRPNGLDGYPMSQWVVVDYGDVLVHIFHHEKRAFYSLEDLWSDAPRLPLPEAVNLK